MADRLKEIVDEATRGQARAPRPRVSDIGRVDVPGRYRADIAAGQADIEDMQDRRRMGYAKGGSVTVPQMCKGGKVIKSWGR